MSYQSMFWVNRLMLFLTVEKYSLVYSINQSLLHSCPNSPYSNILNKYYNEQSLLFENKLIDFFPKLTNNLPPYHALHIDMECHDNHALVVGIKTFRFIALVWCFIGSWTWLVFGAWIYFSLVIFKFKLDMENCCIVVIHYGSLNLLETRVWREPFKPSEVPRIFVGHWNVWMEFRLGS